MKTAVSIDDRVYRSAENTAGQMGMTRSKFYTLAVEEYIQNHGPEFLLERLNAVYAGENTKVDDDIHEAQFRLFSGEDW
jgi:antitoxin component of RelBE/YafQ-DinJ toxin-antitoxin module